MIWMRGNMVMVETRTTTYSSMQRPFVIASGRANSAEPVHLPYVDLPNANMQRHLAFVVQLAHRRNCLSYGLVPRARAMTN